METTSPFSVTREKLPSFAFFKANFGFLTTMLTLIVLGRKNCEEKFG